MNSARIVADIAVGEVRYRTDSGELATMQVGVPILRHVDHGILWASNQGFPMTQLGFTLAVQLLGNVMRASMQYWVQLAQATDWSITFGNFEAQLDGFEKGFSNAGDGQ